MNKLYNKALLFSLFGTAMWFFGNLYEAIVIGPNMLSNSVQRLQAFRDFFALTNPAFFYIPVPQLAIIALIVLFIKTPGERAEIKKTLRWAVVLEVAAALLSVYIITQLNLKLFFATPIGSVDIISPLAVQWNILNIIRVLMVGGALVFVFQAIMKVSNERRN